jgi:hypothetical protein
MELDELARQLPLCQLRKVEAVMSGKRDEAIEKLAEAWASIDGKLQEFRACKRSRKTEDKNGYYLGYFYDADELLKRWEKRGFTFKSKSIPTTPTASRRMME